MISIIIPVYNAEKYLSRCIDSVLNQTFEDYEILLIDDGSIDSSGDICDKYVAIDYRIKVFHKSNGGVSSARNLGIAKATGTWITFVDSDDWVEKEYLSAFSQEYDLSLQGYYNGTMPIHYRRCIVTDNPGAEYLYREYVFGPYCKLFKSDIIRKNRLSFDSAMSYGEDILFLMQYIQHSKTMFVSDYSGYHYIPGNVDSLSLRKHSFDEVYAQYVKHIDCYEKIMAESPYADYVMRKEIIGMFYFFVYIYQKNYKDIKKDNFMKHCFDFYLHFIDKMFIVLFPKKMNIYKRAFQKFIKR